MKESIVSDSACLIALDRIAMLHLLEALYSTVLIRPAVQQECGILQRWLRIEVPTNDALVRALRLQLHNGEAEAVALASEKGLPCILDDRKARRVCRNVGVPVVGTVGVILR